MNFIALLSIAAATRKVFTVAADKVPTEISQAQYHEVSLMQLSGRIGKSKVPALPLPVNKSHLAVTFSPCQNGLDRTRSWTKSGMTGITNLQELPFKLEGGDLRIQDPPVRKSCAREVPKILHFIWLDSSLNRKRATNIVGVAKKNPDWEVMLWADTVLADDALAILDTASSRSGGPIKIQFVSDQPGVNQQHRFQKWDIIKNSPHFERKAAFLRLEVVHLHGGIYFDTDAHAIHSLDDYTNQHGSLFQWPFVVYEPSNYKNLCNCVFGDSKGSPFLSYVLENMAAVTKRGEEAGGAYGCGILTKSFELYGQSDIQMIPDDVLLHRTSNQTIMFQDFEGSWLHDNYGRRRRTHNHNHNH